MRHFPSIYTTISTHSQTHTSAHTHSLHTPTKEATCNAYSCVPKKKDEEKEREKSFVIVIVVIKTYRGWKKASVLLAHSCMRFFFAQKRTSAANGVKQLAKATKQIHYSMNIIFACIFFSFSSLPLSSFSVVWFVLYLSLMHILFT